MVNNFKTKIVRVFFRLSVLKGTLITLMVVILDLNSLSGTKPRILTTKKYDDQSRPFYMRFLPRV